MIILGIETSCDETAASVLEGSNTKLQAKILSSTISSQIKIHAKTGGVVPEVAARMHIEKIIPVIDQALKIAKISLKEIDAIAVTTGPGLITSLMVGVDSAKAMGAALNIPVIPINHMEAHVFSAFIKTAKPSFPAIALVVSGGHTELVLVKNWLNYKKIGATVDDAAGEAFDKIAKLLGLPYPGGPALSKLAEKGKAVIDFPRPMINSNNFNFSFSGLKTAVLYFLRNRSKNQELRIKYKKADIAASAQQAIVDVLVSKTIHAAKKYKVKTITLGGGVAANKLLQKILQAKSYQLKAKFFAAAKNLCTDNAAMIAYTGYLHTIKKARPVLKLQRIRADANWELL